MESSPVTQENLFSFGHTIISGNLAFTGAAKSGGKEYSIAQHNIIAETHGMLNGLTPEHVRLNYEPEQLNPLYNQRIIQLNFSSQKLIAVPADHPNQFFILENLLTTSQQSLLAVVLILLNTTAYKKKPKPMIRTKKHLALKRN